MPNDKPLVGSTPMIEVIPDLPGNVVGVEGVGEVTSEDYKNVLIPDEVRIFPTAERAAAEAWVTGDGS